MRSLCRGLISGALGAVVVGCAGGPDAGQPATSPSTAGLPRVDRLWVSKGTDYANTDSLATLRRGDGGRVYATAKEGDRIDVFDMATGRHLETIGAGEGSAAGELDRPNDIIPLRLRKGNGGVAKRLIVVERNNHRVQAFTPAGRSAGTFGSEALHRPYGATAAARRDGVRLYVTDTTVAPQRKIKGCAGRMKNGRVVGEHVDTLGAASGPGRLGQVETILHAAGRLFVSDETAKHLKVYRAAGGFTGSTVGEGLIRGDPEGLAIVRVGGERRSLIVTDQREAITVWHTFDAETLTHQTSFTGEGAIADTDGIAVFKRAVPGDRRGALIAVHRDRDLRAFGLTSIVRLIRR